MYAIAKIGGMQFKAEVGKNIDVPHIAHKEVGDKIEFDEILLIQDGEKSFIGQPTVKKAKVIAEIVDQKKGDKLIVFKKKRRKGYSVKTGHRQLLTEVTILDIHTPKKTSSKKAKEKEEEIVEEAKPEEQQEEIEEQKTTNEPEVMEEPVGAPESEEEAERPESED